MDRFSKWLDENHIVVTAYDKHDNNRKVFSATAKNQDEVKSHLANMNAHVQKTGRTHHVLVYDRKRFEHQSHTIKVHNPTGHRKYDS